MHMLNVSLLLMQSIRSLQLKLWCKLISLCMHYLSTNKSKQEKKAKFTKLSFCQKSIFGIKLLHANVQCVYIKYAKYHQVVSSKAVEQVDFLTYAQVIQNS